MRILVIAEGVDRSEAQVYAGLKQAGFHLDIWTAPDVNQNIMQKAGLDFSTIRVSHRLDCRATAFFREKLQTGEYSAVYAPINRTLSVALRATRKCGTPVVGYRGTTGHISRFDPGSRLTYLNRRLARIVCVSEAVRNYLMQFSIPSGKLVTINKGHDPAWYRDSCVGSVRAEFGIPANAVLLGFAGRIRPIKGVDILLRAIKALPLEAAIHLLIAGEIADRRVNRLLKDPALGSRVHLAGYRDAAWRLMGQCDIFVMPSVGREGLPRAVIEAMAQGVPAVVSDVGGMPGLVRDGIDGIVVPPGNADALKTALLRLSGDNAKRIAMGLNAQDRIATDYHVRNTVAAYVQMFNEICNV